MVVGILIFFLLFSAMKLRLFGRYTYIEYYNCTQGNQKYL